MQSRNKVEAMLERVADSPTLRTAPRHHLIMALEWVLDAGVSTSHDLESWLDEEEGANVDVEEGEDEAR
jgi:hypothetical protein